MKQENWYYILETIKIPEAAHYIVIQVKANLQENNKVYFDDLFVILVNGKN
jgi:hypothetical protein